MFTKKKIIISLTVLAVLVIGLSISAFALPKMVGGLAEDVSQPGSPHSHGRGADQTYLAEALGITVEELELAQQAASEKAIDLAVEEGILTQEQADAMKTLGIGLHGFRSMPREELKNSSKIDHEALLAEELGITVEELQAAHEAAKETAIQNAVEKGDLSQEQVELMKARQALMAYRIDHKSITAQVLGISVEELQAAQEEGLQIKDLLEKYDVSFDDLQEAMQTAYQESVQEALADGAITQEQAELLLSDEFNMGHMRPHGRFKGMDGEFQFGEPFGKDGGKARPGGFGGELPPKVSNNEL